MSPPDNPVSPSPPLISPSTSHLRILILEPSPPSIKSPFPSSIGQYQFQPQPQSQTPSLIPLSSTPSLATFSPPRHPYSAVPMIMAVVVAGQKESPTQATRPTHHCASRHAISIAGSDSGAMRCPCQVYYQGEGKQCLNRKKREV